MARLLINVDEHRKFEKDDMLIYDGKKFISIRKEHVLSELPKMKKRIEDLESQIKVLKATIDFDHGIITEEEYNELCGGK